MMQMVLKWGYEYFMQVLNMEDIREVNINVVGNWQMQVWELNERVIFIEEVREAVNEIKSDKAPGLDEFQVKCI